MLDRSVDADQWGDAISIATATHTVPLMVPEYFAAANTY